MLPLRLALLASFVASAPLTVTVKQEQLFKLVARVVRQPTQGSLPSVEGYYVTTADFITNARELLLIRKSGNTTQQGERIKPENYYTNSSAVTVRQSLTTADAQRPFAFELFPQLEAASPAGYCAVLVNNDVAWNGSEVFTVAAGQPYFGINNPPNNYNLADPKEGQYPACELDEGLGPRIQFHVRADITDADEDPGACANIRLLPNARETSPATSLRRFS